MPIPPTVDPRESKHPPPPPGSGAPVDPMAFLSGGGGMGALMRAHDWASTPLGPAEGWPQSLRSTLSACLNSPIVGAVLWGPDLILLYNDAYAPTLGERHPDALGRPVAQVWGETWDRVAHSFQETVRTGAGFSHAGVEFPLMRHGREEVTVWDFAAAPIRGEDGVVAGILNQGVEVTGRMLAERRAADTLERQGLVFQQMPGFVAVLTGPDHVYAYVNDAYVEISGPRRFMGRPVRDVFPEIEGQGFIGLLDRVYASGEPFAAKAMPVRLSGEDEDRFVDLLYQPIREAGGAVTGIFVGGYDITERVRAEHALREREERHRALIENIDVGFCVIEMRFDADERAVDYRIVEGNPAFERQTGLVSAQGRWVSELVPDLERHWFDAYGRVALTGEPVRFENGAETMDGRWYDVHALPIGDPAARQVAVLFNDISGRRRTETALAALNENLERQVAGRTAERNRIWRISRDMLLVARGDGTWLSANPAWTRVLGWTEEELIGRRFGDLAHPGDMPAVRACLAGLASGDDSCTFEARVATKAGPYRDLAWTVVSEEGGLYCVARDVTVEKARAVALRLYENIFTSDTAPICAFDRDFRVVAFNRAHDSEFVRINGFPSRVGDVFPDLFPPDQRPVMRSLMARALSGESFTVIEEFGRPEFGKPSWEISYAPLRDEHGGIVGAFHHARDVSSRLRAEAELAKAHEALRQSQKLEAIGQLTGGVAHDFNNLLTIIRSSVDFLRRPDLPEERKRRYLDAVSDTIDRATRLTGQLLAFARRQALKPQVFDVGARLVEVADMLDTVTGARIKVVTRGLDASCHVRADQSQFETALVNLAVNARDAMEGEGRLTLSLHAGRPMPAIRGHGRSQALFVAVSVQDTGSGIPPDLLAQIFEPFFTTKEVGKGTGLGLSQVFGFAKQSGGDVDVASVVGEGTTFTLYLPEVDAPDTAAAPSRPAPAADQGLAGHGLRVLLVEDNLEVGRFCTQILEDIGYATDWATNAEEALERLGADGAGYDAVFSDVVMPGIGGLELAKRLRERMPDLPVVLASGYSHVLAREDDHGFELLHKPYSAEQLARILRRVTAGTRRPGGRNA